MAVFDFQRLDNILNLLIQKNEPIHINELSSFCGVSDRTIRSDINTINDYITENGASINLIRKKGYIISYTNKEKFNLFWKNQDTGTFLFTSSDSRIKYLIRKFLTSDTYITQEYLQSILFVSPNTLYSDFRIVKKYFSSYNLKIANKSNLGYITNGQEQDKRAAIIDLIFKENISDYITGESNIVKDFCCNVDYNHFTALFNDYFKKTIQSDSDYFYRNLFNNIFLSVSRIKSGNTIQQFAQNIKLKIDINEIIDELENQFKININKLEKQYFQFLIAENFPNYIDNNTELLDQELAECIVTTIYNVLSELTEANWLSDKTLKDSLLKHIKLFLNVQTIEGSRSNPILDTIKNNFPYAFDLAVACCQEVVNKYNIHFSEDEISYIALHFANAIEKHAGNSKNQFSLAIVCGSGKTFSSIIETKIKRSFPNTISKITKYSYANFINEQAYHSFDLIISTIPIQTSIDNLVFIDINNLELSMVKIKQRLENYEKITNEGNFLSPKRFMVLSKKTTKDDLLAKLDTILTNQQLVNEHFLEDIYKRENISSTVIGNNIAIPHPVGDSVLKSHIYTIIAPKGITWDKQNIKFVFLFAIKSDDTEKIEALYESLLEFISSKSKQELLLKTPTFETLSNIFLE